MMRTKKSELVSNELKPIICQRIKEAREKYNYSLEDLARALNYKKNRQTIHKYETGALNIPYDIFFEICRVLKMENIDFDDIPTDEETRDLFEKKYIKNYIKSSRGENDLTHSLEKIINTYKNASYEPLISSCELRVKVLDDSMEPLYLKGDKLSITKVDNYKNGDDVIIAIKNNVLVVRRLYKYPKGIILQAMNAKYPTICVNVFSNDMIVGKVNSINRIVK